MSHIAGEGGLDDRASAARQRLARLSKPELEAAVAVVNGWSNAEIAERLFMSIGSVKARVSSTLTKLIAQATTVDVS